MNPLDRIGAEFALSLTNPNPKAARLKDGPRYRVEFEVDAEAFEQFMAARELAGMVIEAHCTVAALNESLNPERGAAKAEGAGATADPGHDEPRAPGDRQLSSQLHINGYFRNPNLWLKLHDEGIYTLAMHKAFIKAQGCLFDLARRVTKVVSQDFEHSDSLCSTTGKSNAAVHELASSMEAGSTFCEGQISLHHVSRADLPAAGKQRQPEAPNKVPHFYGVPLCSRHHQLWAHGSHSRAATDADKELMREIAVGLTAYRVKLVAKAFMGIESLAELDRDPAPLEDWEAATGIAVPR